MRPTIKAIADEVGARHGVTYEQMQSASCLRKITKPRQEAYYLAREAGHTPCAIARAFAKDHTTIIYGVKAHCDRIGLHIDRREAKAWPEEQFDVIRQNPHLDDDELVPLVNAVGPERTASGVGNARRKLGIRRVQSREARVKGGLKAAELNSDWPKLVGSDEERHERYCALVLRGLAEVYGVQVAA